MCVDAARQRALACGRKRVRMRSGSTRPRALAWKRRAGPRLLHPHSSSPAVARHGFLQDLPDQAVPGQETEAEPPHPAVDPDENRQYDPLQLQEKTLEKNQAGPVRPGPS